MILVIFLSCIFSGSIFSFYFLVLSVPGEKDILVNLLQD
jgi:hypothetical protein